MQFLACDEFPSAFNQDGEDLKRLPRKAQPHSVFTEFTGLTVDLKCAKAADGGRLRCVRHTNRKRTTRWAVLETGSDVLRNEGVSF